MSFYGLVDGSEASLKSYLNNLSGVDQVGADARAAMLATRSIKTSSKRWAIETAITMVDLTTLEGADTPGKVKALCTKAVRPDPTDSTVPSVGAVCVYNDMVSVARTHLDLIGGQHVPVAAVSTAFPSGRASMPVKIQDTQDAIDAGAAEIDMVIEAMALQRDPRWNVPATSGIHFAGAILNGGTSVASCLAEGRSAASRLHADLFP